jgi:dihydrofolate reductase
VTAPRNGKPSIVLVVAVAENGVIGRDGALPWRLKSDMQHFRRLTMGKPVLMGRKTYVSLSRKPLPGRTNIVVSRDPSFAASGVLVAPNVAAALTAARGDALRRSADAVMVIGGADIFLQTMDVADRLEVTCVHARPDGDTRLSPINLDLWREVARKQYDAGPEDDAGFTISTYERAN